MSRSQLRRVALALLCCAVIPLTACSVSGNGGGSGGSGSGSSGSDGSAHTPDGSGGSPAAIPTSCDSFTATVDRDLGTTTAKVELGPTGSSPTSLDCQFDAETDQAAGYVAISFDQADPSMDLTTDVGWKAFKAAVPGTATDLSGIGDKAFSVTNDGEFGGLNVLSHQVIITLGPVQLPTNPPLDNWKTLAKDLAATLS